MNETAAPTLATSIFRSVADDIVNGVIRPGTRLEERALVERFEASRTPVREALRELAARGLAELVPRRGCVVVDIDTSRLSDMLEAECELESLCARLAAERMRSVEKRGLEQHHQQTETLVAAGDVGAYLVRNREFHDLICAGTGNETLARMVRELRYRLAPFRQAQDRTERRLPVSHEEHEAIVAAILRGDGVQADAAMRGHNARLSSGVLARRRQSLT